MIRTIVIDDESLMREEVKKRVADFFPKDIAIVAEAGTVVDALKIITKFEPELVFLDVHLTDGTGFDVIEKTTYKDFNVIFITGFDTNAIKAIRVGALDYILKPIADDEFKDAVQKAIDSKAKENSLDTSIAISQDHYRGINQKRIVLKTTEGVYAVQEDDILYCHSEGNYTTVYTQDQGKILVSNHLKKIEELLPVQLFVRCHQSFIVNKMHVLKYNKNGTLLLKNKVEVPVSARRKDFTLKNIF